MALTKVSGNLIADNAVGLSQLAGGTDGNLITFDASGNPSHVPTGTATHVLTSNGAGAAPTFQVISQTSGAVLEEVALLCNGTSQTVSSGTYTSQNVTGVQDLDNTFTDVTGSSIAYTPPAGTTRVVYTLSVHFSYAAAVSISSIKTFLDSDEVTSARQQVSSGYTEGVNHLKWVFKIGGSADTATGRVASWDSAKTIKLQAREHSGNPQKMHVTTNWDSTTSAQLRLPILNIKAIK